MMTINNNDNNSGDGRGNEKPVKQSRFRLAVNGIVGRLFLAPLAPIALLALGANTLIGKGKPSWVTEFDQYAEGVRGGFVTVCWMVLFIMALTTGFVVLVLGPVVGVKAAAVIGYLTFPVSSTMWDLAKLEDE